MDFTLLVTLVELLLEREGRLSYRYIQRQFGLDDDTLEAILDAETPGWRKRMQAE